MKKAVEVIFGKKACIIEIAITKVTKASNGDKKYVRQSSKLILKNFTVKKKLTMLVHIKGRVTPQAAPVIENLEISGNIQRTISNSCDSDIIVCIFGRPKVQNT